MKSRAIELALEHQDVYFLTYNEASRRTLQKYFNELGVDVKVGNANFFDVRIIQPNKNKPEEYVLLGNNNIHILLDELSLLKTHTIDRLTNDLRRSSYSFDIFCLYTEI